MSLKTYKPYTKSTRGTVLVDRSGLWKGKPFKPLTSVNNARKGRNNQGRITSRNHGGGHKQKYRMVDFYRTKFDTKAVVERIEYDPNRSCYIMLVKFVDGKRFYYWHNFSHSRYSDFTRKGIFKLPLIWKQLHFVDNKV